MGRKTRCENVFDNGHGNMKEAGENRALHLNELDEIRRDVYESSKIYKNRTKVFHDCSIRRKTFVP